MKPLASLKSLARRRPTETVSAAGVPTALIRTPEAASSGVLVCFRDGVAYEPEDLWGISHFLEHAVFRGTETHPSLYDISRAVERFGGRVSAHSTREMTAYWAKIPPGHEGAALEVLAELVSKPLLKDEHIEAERAIISQERRREAASPATVCALAVESLLLRPSPLSRHPVGSPESLERIDQKALRGHLAEAYHRGSAAAAAAGALPDGFLAGLEKTLGSLPDGRPRPRADFAAGSRLAGADAVIIPSPMRNQAQLCMGWRFPVESEEERLAWRAVNTLLGAGYTSLLNRTLREKENVTYLATTKLSVYPEGAVFKVSLGTAARDLERAAGLVSRVLEDVAEGKISEDLFAEAVTRHAANVVFRMEEPLETARILGERLMRDGAGFSFEEYVSGLEAVDFREAAELVRRHLVGVGPKTVLCTGSEEARRAFPGAVAAERGKDGALLEV